MREIEILYPDMEKVLESLNHGQVDAIEEAVEQITDEFMIYGLRGCLIEKLSRGFPDPRREEEISTKVILTASMAGHFQDMYIVYAMGLPSRKCGSITLCFAFTHITCRTGIECEGAEPRMWYIPSWDKEQCSVQWRRNP